MRRKNLLALLVVMLLVASQLFLLVSQAPATPVTVFEADFESGSLPVGMTVNHESGAADAHWGVITDWLTRPAPVPDWTPGSKSLWCAGYGTDPSSGQPYKALRTYPNNMRAYVEFTVDLSGYQNGNARMVVAVNIPSLDPSSTNDFGLVTANGNPIWYYIQPTPGWYLDAVPLQAFVGQQVTLRIYFISDASNIGSPQGMFIDYLKVEAVPQGENLPEITQPGGQPPDTEAPTAPSNLTGEPGDAKVTLSWGPSYDNIGVVGYEVYRKLLSGTDFVKIGEAPYVWGLTTYLDQDGLVNGQTYQYFVRALDAAGNFRDSTTVTVTPQTPGGGGGNGGGGGGDTTPPATPTGLQAVPGDRQVTLYWDANTEDDLAGYNIYRALSGSGPWTKIGSLVQGTVFVDAGLENDTIYYYRITAEDNSGNESYPTFVVSATPGSGFLPAPTGLTAIPGDQQAILTWNPVSSPSLAGYNIYRGLFVESINEKLNTTPLTSTTFIDTGLTNGITYYYQVVAVDNSGREGQRSAYVSVVPGTEPPSDVFTDISTHWARGYILYLADQGLINGYPDGTFRPDNTITRAEFAKIAVIAKGLNLPTQYHGYFSDVYSTHWAWQYIEAARDAGIIEGYPDGSFRPDAKITRAEIAKVVVEAAGYDLIASGSGFSDVASDYWAYSYILTAKQHQVISGYPDGTFRPMNNATRAEASKMIYGWISGQ